jgi:hypothetical protein
MNSQPLTSNDLAKILIFILLLLPTVIFGFGIVPLIFLGFGIYMMTTTQDFSHIETAVSNFKVYMRLSLVIGIFISLYWGYQFYTRDRYLVHFIGFLLLSLIPVVYIVLINKLFHRPLSEHSDWVAVNGFFPKKLSHEKIKSDMKVNIIKGEKLKSYSVADELLKWAKLKDDGHISEDEFNDAREKLLKRS